MRRLAETYKTSGASSAAAPIAAAQPHPILAQQEFAEVLRTRLGLDPQAALQEARVIGRVAETDVYAAIAGAAMRARVAPERLRGTFNLTREQIARKLDDFVRIHHNITDPQARAFIVAERYFNRFGDPMSANDAAALAGGAEPVVRPINPPKPRATPSPLASPAEPATQPPATDDLATRFGEPAEPIRIETYERTPDGRGVITHPRVQQIGAARPELTPFVPYLWVVDESGRLLIAIETAAKESPAGLRWVLGHPTLAGSSRVRMAGELFYDAETTEWVLVNSGGRYALGGRTPNTRRQVENVADLFRRTGLKIRVVYSPF